MKKRWFRFRDGNDIIIGYENNNIPIDYPEEEHNCIFHGVAVYDTRTFIFTDNKCPHPVHFDTLTHIEFITETEAFMEML
jgi:hypothetical protein